MKFGSHSTERPRSVGASTALPAQAASRAWPGQTRAPWVESQGSLTGVCVQVPLGTTPTSSDFQALSHILRSPRFPSPQMGSRPPLRVWGADSLHKFTYGREEYNHVPALPLVTVWQPGGAGRATGPAAGEPADAWAQAAISRLLPEEGCLTLPHPTPTCRETRHPCQAVSYHPEGPQRAAQLCRHLTSALWGDQAGLEGPQPSDGHGVCPCGAWGRLRRTPGDVECRGRGLWVEGGVRMQAQQGQHPLLCPVLAPRLLALEDRWAWG